jgi:aldehyde:ferredoxin oxidoreductase
MSIAKGYTGKVLRVDLTKKRFSTEPLREDAAKSFIGGRGLGAKYLFDEVPAGTDPLGEKNKMMFITGPLCSTLSQASSRWMVVTKSPLTGTIVRSSGGADFGHEMKSAGYDIVIIEGKAEKPVTLFIKDDAVEFRDAATLWGKEIDTEKVQEIIRKDIGDEKVQVACIGTAGENGTLFASIMNARRSASRGGVGTVMGSKNLKAIAVRGTGKVEVADKEKINEVTKQIVSESTKTHMYENFSHLGTPGVTALLHEMGMHPAKNFQMGQVEDFSGLTPDKLQQIFLKDEGCFRCFIHCGSVFQIKEGLYKGAPVVAPEYETMWSFGVHMYNTDLGFVVAANKVCDDYGVDTISAGSSIAFAMELYERGILSKKDLDGIDLTWGNHQEAYRLLLKIVKREGIGNILSLGTRRAAEKIGNGAEKYAMQIKGLEIPAYELRGAKAHGLNIATSNIGASHMTGYCPHELFGLPEPVDRFSVAGKGSLIKSIQDFTSTYDSLIICGFPATFGWMVPPTYAALLSAATGVAEFSDVGYLIQAGERIYNIERAFNTRDDFGRKDDYAPERFITEPVTNGPSQGQIFENDVLLDDYYQARGWVVKTGIPTQQKLEELGLKKEAEELKKTGKV